MRTKRGDVGIGWIFVIVLVMIFLVWLTQYSSRACHSNVDCGDNMYCGSDFACHQLPTQTIVERHVVESSSGQMNNLVLPSLVIALAIVLAAFVIRWRNTPHEERAKQSSPHHSADSQQFEDYGENIHEEKHHHH